METSENERVYLNGRSVSDTLKTIILAGVRQYLYTRNGVTSNADAALRREKFRLAKNHVISRLHSTQPAISEKEKHIAYTRDGRRYRLSVGRFLTRMMKMTEYVNSLYLELIANNITEHIFSDTLRFEIVSGSLIGDAYYESFGVSSCMTGYRLYVDLYERNSKYNLLKAWFANNEGRAMLVELDNGNVLLDKVYSDSCYLANKMIDYAREQGFWIRKDSCSIETCDGRPLKDYGELIVSGLEFVNDGVPYQDTLTGYNIDRNKDGQPRLSLMHPDSGFDYMGEATRTDGRLRERCYCEHCEEVIDEDDCYMHGGYSYCESCYDDLFVVCANCGAIVSRDDTYYIEGSICGDYCTSCTRSHTNICEKCNHRLDERHDDVSEYTADGVSRDLCDDCVDDFHQCDDCGDLFSASLNEGDDGLERCDDCDSEYNDSLEQEQEQESEASHA